MSLTKIRCDGCGRAPNFWEWCRGELTPEGYSDWRHPGIIFRDAGCPITYDSHGKCQRLFHALFGRPMPEELSFLCPECQRHAERELPALSASDRGGPGGPGPGGPSHYFG
jgi:hypothetical protein